MKVLWFCLLFSISLHAQNIDLSGLSSLTPSSETAETDDPVNIKAINATDSNKDSIALHLVLQMKKGVYLYSTSDHFFNISYKVSGIDSPVVIDLPAQKTITNFDGKKVKIFTNGQKITLRSLKKSDSWRFHGLIQYQACDTAQCFLPANKTFLLTPDVREITASETEDVQHNAVTLSMQTEQKSLDSLLASFSVEGKSGGFQPVDSFLEFLKSPGQNSDMFLGKSIFLIIILTILGGIALNLTPCVLPMIPITLAVIGAGAQSQSRVKGLLIGSVYGTAMALTYGVLGLIVALTGSQFGVLNASPVFNIGIAVIFILLALGMFDIIHIDFTKFRSGITQKNENKGKIIPVFVMGIIAALLAGACVAPVVISVILYAATQFSEGNTIALLLPFILGAGMALPWPFAGAGLSLLPKPGQWMVWVRNGFGVIILIIGLYYAYLGGELILEAQRAHKIASSVKEDTNALPWDYSLEKGLSRALRENKPVFIDFWASWCKNCVVMDKTTFRDETVRKELNNYILIKYKAENPKEPATKKILDYFNIVGLPSYVILRPEK